VRKKLGGRRGGGVGRYFAAGTVKEVRKMPGWRGGSGRLLERQFKSYEKGEMKKKGEPNY